MALSPFWAGYPRTGYPSKAGLPFNVSVEHKFGFSNTIGTSFAPITFINSYMMPQVGAETTLRVKAGDANDTADGDGAREVTLQGLDATGAAVTEAIPTAGLSAGAASANSFLRLWRAWVSKCGTYATGSVDSHAADVVIENGAGGTEWATMNGSDYALSQSQIAARTVPLGKTGYISDIFINVDSNKPVDIRLMQRRSILDTVAPYEAMRLIEQWAAVAGALPIDSAVPLGPFPALTDLIFFGKVAAGTGSASVDFTLILIDE